MGNNSKQVLICWNKLLLQSFFSLQKLYALKILRTLFSLYFGTFIHKDGFTNDTLFTKVSLKQVIPVFEI